MKVWVKRVLISLVVLVIVAIVGLAIFLLTFNPNAYKANLQRYVFENYQRTLKIDGEIQLSLFPRIGLAVEKVSLTNRDSTETFMAMDSARLAVAIWPLLYDRLVVDHVAVSGFRAWVTRNAEGEFNFRDLVGPAQDAAAGVVQQPPASPVGQDAAHFQPERATALHIDIAGLELSNGEIHFYDNPTGYSARLVRLDVATGRVTANQAFDVSLKGHLYGDFPVADSTLSAQAIIKFDPGQKTYSAQKLDVQLAGRLADLQNSTVALRGGSLAYDAFARMVGASGIELVAQGNLSGKFPVSGLDTRLTVPQLRIDESRAEFIVEKLAYRAKGTYNKQPFELALDAPGLSVSPSSAKGEPVAGTFKYGDQNRLTGVAVSARELSGDAFNLKWKEIKLDGNLKDGDRLVRLNLLSPASWEVFAEKGGFSAIKGDVVIEDPALPNGSFEFPFIGSVQANLPADEITSQINAVLSGSNLDLNVKATQLKDPKVVLSLKTDKLNIDQLVPAGQPASATPGSAPEAASGDAKPGAAPAAKAASEINLSFLNALDIAASVAINDLTVRRLRAQQFSAQVRVLDGVLTVDKAHANLYQGKLDASLRATADNTFDLDLDMRDVALGSLLTDITGEDRLMGKAAVTARLNTSGTTSAALVAGLGGPLQLRVRDGAIRGFNIAQTLREVNDAVRNIFSGQPPAVVTQYDPSRKTDFTALDVDVTLAQGQGTFTKLRLAAPLLRVTEGKPATIDLVNQQLDVLVNVNVVNTRTGQEGKVLEELQGVTVPLRLSGPISQPGYQVQWSEISSQAVKQAVEQGLVDVLSRKLGVPPGGDGTPTPPPANAAPARPEDAVKSIGDALKGLLGR
ncbi:MAG: AsmA family protein [Burkholderiaceae bacterium]